MAVVRNSRNTICTTSLECEKGRWFSESKLAITTMYLAFGVRYWFEQGMGCVQVVNGGSMDNFHEFMHPSQRCIHPTVS
ncbi:hypothetical protein TNCV_3146271 [Trichonephila clavipes]|nr:hypothetical protein TNCV_3146271 [Trichonephila clavipes]